MFSYVYTTYFDHIYSPIPLSDPSPSLENLFPTICPPPIQSFVTVIWHCHPHICWTPLVTIKGYMCPVGCRLDTPRLDFILLPMAMLLYAQPCLWSSCPLSSTDIDLKVTAYIITDSGVVPNIWEEVWEQGLRRFHFSVFGIGFGDQPTIGALKRSAEWTNAFWHLDLLFMSILDQASLRIDVFRMNSRCSKT